ncbi:hypothetical protein CTAYLR_002888 [Chrysophaeum taylorii]|uniref:Uncharacterized protein n=1 Tax=Chrysophaeum taylorii TaxID=2483200 RepID=A0AAD7UNK5_9STRA|nr:hypothetical protein CTAYLR_002888 [Chrysophaeum taylorii]
MGVLSKVTTLSVVGLAAAAAAAETTVKEELRAKVCPQSSLEIRYGSHVLPKTVFYTGKSDGHLRNLTYGPRGEWPDDYQYVFFDNEALDESMHQLAALLEDEIDGVYEAFSLLRPWAYKADLWRYCILWACGGVYVDSKLALAEPFDDFVWNVGFNPDDLDRDVSPQLYSCRDDLASDTMHPKSRVTCLWQGILVAERGSRALLQTIYFVVNKVRARWYPPYELTKMPWLFLTGPGAIALATQASPSWRDHIKLRCRMTYTPRTDGLTGLQNPHLVGDWNVMPGENVTVYDDNLTHASFIADAGLHETQRTNNYGKLFKTHLIYTDEERAQNMTWYLHTRARLPKAPSHRQLSGGDVVAADGDFAPSASQAS